MSTSQLPRRAVLLALPLVALLSACGATAGTTATEEAPTVALEHSAGVTEVPEQPQRIVTTTDQNALLPLLELGVVPVASAGMVGDGGAESFRRVEGLDTSAVEFTGAYGEPNLEAVAAARPDLIVGYEYDEAYEEFSAIAPTVFIQIFDRPLTEALLDFAELVGETEQAEERLAAYEARIADLQAALEPVRDELSVSVIAADEPGQFGRADEGQALGTVMADLDLRRPEPEQGTADPDAGATSLEQISRHDADVVLVVDFSGERQSPGQEALMSSPLTGSLAASQAGQLHVIDGTETVGAGWSKMDAFLDELERVLLADDLDVAVVQ